MGCAQAGLTDKPIGVSQEFHRNPPIPGATSEAATTGDSIKIYDSPSDSANAEPKLKIGGTVNVGDFLKPDALGRGITTTTQGDYFGAVARQSGTYDQEILVHVQNGHVA